MNNLKAVSEKDKKTLKTNVFPTVEQIINDLQFQLSNINSSEEKKINSNGKKKFKNYCLHFIFFFLFNTYLIIHPLNYFSIYLYIYIQANR